MLFTTAVLTSFVAATAFAHPSPEYKTTKAEAPKTFGLITIRSGSGVQNSGVQASRGSLLVNLQSQNATCEKESNFATFFIENEELKLYAAWAKPQTVYVDRSGMGQGKIGYSSCAEVSLPRNAETKGWKITDGGLTFGDNGVQACPGALDGGWSLWLTGVAKPGGLENCVGVNAKVIDTTTPVGCRYTES
ncbi:hypothetical protein BU24DRAFT_426690 [Aaosphaeria arxii CBS 175.79]|uniref:Cell wall protein PhiA n=1 Tax=Aaosphaeria arxii CBS 175.79 TaxID=1450172 RepID=A0A6A5XFL6_9PLEO|nr:uncharacterized protein BU24DRAFT_426690 [Aaosphaeria arxii CBS 175.79]KAF2011617.1 hypothetical protein BU24DRAFT_426690 [Aaosphaeria arxii CBS 175.79]